MKLQDAQQHSRCSRRCRPVGIGPEQIHPTLSYTKALIGSPPGLWDSALTEPPYLLALKEKKHDLTIRYNTMFPQIYKSSSYNDVL